MVKHAPFPPTPRARDTWFHFNRELDRKNEQKKSSTPNKDTNEYPGGVEKKVERVCFSHETDIFTYLRRAPPDGREWPCWCLLEIRVTNCETGTECGHKVVDRVTRFKYSLWRFGHALPTPKRTREVQP